MRVGFLGGSFDPIHLAHLVMADSCLDLAGLDRVTFVVAASPPHKQDRRLAHSGHRLAMARLAVGGHPGIVVDDREMKRSGPSWTMPGWPGLLRAVSVWAAPGPSGRVPSGSAVSVSVP